MDKQKLKEAEQERAKAKEKLFDLMLDNKSKSSVRKQFTKFEKAHQKALEAYKDVA